MPIRIPVYCLDWHIHQSPALQELVSNPLNSYIQFEPIGWDGIKLPSLPSEQFKKNTMIFFQLPPPQDLCRDTSRRVVWIPMWDQARGYDLEWWQNLPKNVRVVAFSREISVRARSVGLNTLDLYFYKSPDEFHPANWEESRVLFYWNRTGLVDKNFLFQICQSLDIELLIYRRQIDPLVPACFDYSLPKRLGKTHVQEITGNTFLPRREYMNIVNQANIFIAPRVSEGVGLSSIEALARGCAVFAYNAPTMNEYITHKVNGFLFQKYVNTRWNCLRECLMKRMDGYLIRFANIQPHIERPITDWQDWEEIKKLNLQVLGDNARQTQAKGYREWIRSIPEYASFILDW
ncbi:MAG: glycosyltransferase [Dehalococcoidales bacterium]|jgi:hypothetical protein